MKVDNYFSWVCIGADEFSFPDIYCPNCSSILDFDRNSLIKHETTKSKPDDKIYVFTCTYHCSNCDDPVIMVGNGYSEDKEMIIDTRRCYDPDRIEYIPSFFNPTVHLFRIHQQCPTEVKKEIIKSFSHFWNDMDSCVNKLRLSLELLMDYQGITYAYSPINNARKLTIVTLQQRIDMFKKRNQEIGEKLKTVKDIGNKGSHANTRLIVNEVILAYNLLEEALNELYEN